MDSLSLPIEEQKRPKFNNRKTLLAFAVTEGLTAENNWAIVLSV